MHTHQTSGASDSAAAAVADALDGLRRIIYVGGPDGDGREKAGLDEALSALPVAIEEAAGLEQAMDRLEAEPDAVCLLDLERTTEAVRITRALRSRHPRAIVIGVSDPGRLDTAAEAIRAGLFDVLPRRFTPADVAAVIGNAREQAALGSEDEPDAPSPVPTYGVFGNSAAMRAVMELVVRAAQSHGGVLLCGERGSGREMVARAIHSHGARAHGPFVTVDCSTLSPAGLIQELFGSRSEVPPARMARVVDDRIERTSVLAEANGGTLLLEHVTRMGAEIQRKLARLLRRREALVGDRPDRFVLDVRPMAAVEPAADGSPETAGIEPDLHDRLSVIRIDVPPLRHRRDDIPVLAVHFLKDICRTEGYPIKTLTRPAMTLLSALPWHGNAHELRTLLKRVVHIASRGVIPLEEVLRHVRLESHLDATARPATLREARERFERDYIAAALHQHGGRMGEAAEALGLQRPNLYRKIRQLNIARPRVGGLYQNGYGAARSRYSIDGSGLD